MSQTPIRIYTDGACRGNPGPGGWGVLIDNHQQVRELCGGERETTNNRMELTAAIRGLESVPRGSRIIITTDSTYVKNGITQWISQWKKRGWKTASRQPVKNQDLWLALDRVVTDHADIQWCWVKGHSGHRENERADQLANQGLEQCYGAS